MKLLVIADDNLPLVEVLEQVALDAGWSVVTCRDGKELVDVLNELTESAFVLVDINMPELDGVEVAQSLGQFAQLPEIRLRFMTGGSDSLAVAARMIAKARDREPGQTLYKPISIEKFRQVLAEEEQHLASMA